MKMTNVEGGTCDIGRCSLNRDWVDEQKPKKIKLSEKAYSKIPFFLKRCGDDNDLV